MKSNIMVETVAFIVVVRNLYAYVFLVASERLQMSRPSRPGRRDFCRSQSPSTACYGTRRSFPSFFLSFFFYAPSVDFKNYPAPLPLPPTSYILTILTFCFFFALPTVEMRVHLFPRLCGTKLIR